MTTATQTLEELSGRRSLTIADVAALPSQLPSGPVDYELIRGKLLMMSPTGDPHGKIQARIVAAFVVQGDQRGLGTTRTETGVILGRNPDTLLGPDVLFLASSSLPVRLSAEGWWESIPDLVVEVRSRNDRNAELVEKVRTYAAAGVRIVWVVDPQRQVVMEYRGDRPAAEFGSADVLTAEDVLPGFRMSLAELFAP